MRTHYIYRRLTTQYTNKYNQKQSLHLNPRETPGWKRFVPCTSRRGRRNSRRASAIAAKVGKLSPCRWYEREWWSSLLRLVSKHPLARRHPVWWLTLICAQWSLMKVFTCLLRSELSVRSQFVTLADQILIPNWRLFCLHVTSAAPPALTVEQWCSGGVASSSS